MRRPRHAVWQEETVERVGLRHRGLRRWWFAGVAVVAAIAVLVDLPSHGGPAYRRAQLTSYLSTVHSDIGQCNVSLRNAVDAYVGWAEGTAGRTRGLVTAIAHRAIEGCGFDDAGVVNLGTSQPPRAADSPTVERIVHQADAWAYLDGFDTAQDLRAVAAHPADRASLRAAKRDLAKLASRRARLERLVATAERAVGMRPRPFPLVAMGTRLPAGGLPAPPGPSS